MKLFNFPIAENGTFNGSSEAERKTQSFYLSCLNTPKIEELGAQPLIDLIAKVNTYALSPRKPLPSVWHHLVLL